MTEEKVFAVFNSESRESSLAEAAADLLKSQKERWPRLKAGYDSLDSVMVREVQCEGYSAWLQFNPGRIVSTGAKVDAKSIRERPCFLCVENLPDRQQGILYNEEFLILCNPAPIFREHFTISHVKHVPQLLIPSLTRFLDLARDLSPRLTIFYNGPKCGASAPDHMHFQASPAGGIPVEREAGETARRAFLRSVQDVRLHSLTDYGRQVIILESSNREHLQNVLTELIQALRVAEASEDEPMMNVLCAYAHSSWRIILFPRLKHRPDAYFKEGRDQVLISPAAVDIGGLVITPVEKDFTETDAATIEGIFREVSLPEPKLRKVIDSLS